MAQFYQPLELQHLLVNTLVGSIELFYILGIVAISAASSYFRMPGMVYLMMVALFTLFMAPFMASGATFVLVIIITGVIVSYMIGKLIKN